MDESGKVLNLNHAMKRTAQWIHQIVKILKEYESGKATKDICCEHGISAPTFYQWKQKYGGIDAQHLKELKDSQGENSRMKWMFADLSLDHRIYQLHSSH